MHFTDHMTRAERIARIGELLAKGVTLMLAREARDKAESKSVEVLEQSSKPAKTAFCTEHATPENEAETAILAYLRRVGSASPRDIQQALDLSKATAFRRLQRMTKTGLVVRSGQTSAIRYLAMGFAGNQIEAAIVRLNAFDPPTARRFMGDDVLHGNTLDLLIAHHRSNLG